MEPLHSDRRRFPESNNNQYFYKLLVNNTPGDFFDYPQLGFDNSAVTVTANAWCQVVNAPPVSTGLDQQFVEDFGRFLPVECLSWT
ncbi:MAG: hypothetical protein ACRDRU_08510, partial [Pseudonocardiaceae bacterium]